MGEILSKHHPLRETVTVSELYTSLNRYENIHQASFNSTSVKFGHEQFLWVFEHQPEDALKKLKQEERRRTNTLLAQLHAEINQEIDFLAVMCGMAFFSPDSVEEKMRFMFSLFLDDDGEDDVEDPFTLPTDPTTPAGDMASCMFENICKGIMQHIGRDEIITSPFHIGVEASRLTRAICVKNHKDIKSGITLTNVMEYFEVTPLPSAVYYLLNTGFFNIDPPTVVKQPRKYVQINAGEPINIAFKVKGTGPVYYQWTKDGSPVLGGKGTAKMEELVISNAVAGDEGMYHCWVANIMGTMVSKAVFVKVADPHAQAAGMSGMLGLGDQPLTRETLTKKQTTLLKQQVPVFEQMQWEVFPKHPYSAPAAVYPHGQPIVFRAYASVDDGSNKAASWNKQGAGLAPAIGGNLDFQWFKDADSKAASTMAGQGVDKKKAIAEAAAGQVAGVKYEDLYTDFWCNLDTYCDSQDTDMLIPGETQKALVVGIE